MQKRRYLGGVALVAMLSLGAYATASGGEKTSTDSSRPAATAGTMGSRAHGPRMADGCPLQVPGARIGVTDVHGGVAITFTTESGKVAELRRRVERLAAMDDLMGGAMGNYGMMGNGMMGYGMMGRGMMGNGMMGYGMKGYGRMGMPAVEATVHEIEHGARLVLRPKQPGELGVVRERAWMQAGMMAGGLCPTPPATGTGAPAQKSAPAAAPTPRTSK